MGHTPQLNHLSFVPLLNMRTKLYIRTLLSLSCGLVGVRATSRNVTCIKYTRDDVLVSLCCPTISGGGEDPKPGGNITLEDLFLKDGITT